MTELITVHYNLRNHLQTMGIFGDEPYVVSTMKKKNQYLVYCNALANWGTNFLEDIIP